MEIRNGLEGLKSLLGVEPATPASTSAAKSTAVSSAIDNDRATLSSAGSVVSQASAGDGVRAEKVAQVQSALASGTYDVPASAVASKLIDTMLNGQK